MRWLALANALALGWVALSYAIAPHSLERAAWMLPFTADSYAADLSTQLAYRLESLGTADAAVWYRRSLRYDSHQPAAWLRVAGIEERRGNNQAVWNCLERARQYEPNNPEVLWMRANLLLRAGDDGEAVAELGRLLARTRRFDAPVFQILLHLRLPAEALRLAPAVAHLSFLRFALDRRVPVAGLPITLDRGAAGPADIEHWCRRLIEEGAAREAWSRWSGWFEAHHSFRPERALRNGGFDREFAPAPFDWTRGPGTFRDSAAPHSGAASVRTSGDGTLLEQWTLLEPGMRYTLSFWWKAQSLTRNTAFEVVISNATAVLARESTGPGSWPWRRQSLTFVTGPDGLYRIEVRRAAAAQSGTLWLDDLELTATPGG